MWIWNMPKTKSRNKSICWVSKTCISKKVATNCKARWYNWGYFWWNIIRVECSIEVPKAWAVGKEKHLPPYLYRFEMSPIFCNTEVDFEQFGETMQQFILKEYGKICNPKRLLIGGMKAKTPVSHSTDSLVYISWASTNRNCSGMLCL